jgi:hypothetical protein
VFHFHKTLRWARCKDGNARVNIRTDVRNEIVLWLDVDVRCMSSALKVASHPDGQILTHRLVCLSNLVWLSISTIDNMEIVIGLANPAVIRTGITNFDFFRLGRIEAAMLLIWLQRYPTKIKRLRLPSTFAGLPLDMRHIADEVHTCVCCRTRSPLNECELPLVGNSSPYH